MPELFHRMRGFHVRMGLERPDSIGAMFCEQYDSTLIEIPETLAERPGIDRLAGGSLAIHGEEQNVGVYFFQ